MRTNIVIDDKLIGQALKLSKLGTKKKAVEAGLKLLVQFKRQSRIKDYFGQLKWNGDLEKMRRDK